MTLADLGATAVPDRRLAVPVPAIPVTRCRSCGNDRLREFLDLGRTPIANNLVDSDAQQDEPVYPLSVGVCSSCTLVQLTHELPAAEIFGAEYPYFSSVSAALVAHSREHVDDLVGRRRLTSRSFVVELASNDGYLLKSFLPHGIPVLGVEPCSGPASAAREAGVPTVEEYFGAELGARLRTTHGPADVIIANNVMAHVPDLNGFVAGMAALVADDGVLRIENPSVQYLIENVEFDTIYHEHFCYFSTIAVERLMRRHGLYLQDVEVFPKLHGGTLRWTCGRLDRRSDAVDERLSAEAAAGLLDFSVFDSFATRVTLAQTELLGLLRRIRADGKTIAAYGAAAKGATLLNASDIGADLIDFVVDRSPFKQGKLIPGVRIPILDPSALIDRRPDFVLLLAWNFRDEIVGQQHAYINGGGRFIIPVPTLSVL